MRFKLIRSQNNSKVKYLLALLCLGFLTSVFASPAVFRIGTGGSGGTYFPIGSLIAASISDAFSGGADLSGTASANGLFAVAQRSNGSVANVEDLENGLLEGALSQADVTHWAYHGTGPYSAQPAKSSLRAVASLYPESLHLVVRTESKIRSVHDLIGHRVSIDEAGSGTLFDVRTVLEAYGIDVEQINAVYLKSADAIDRFRQDKLDAFFIVAGYPVSAISELVSENKAVVVPIDGIEIDNLLRQYPFFSRDVIPAGTYSSASEVPTVAVTAQLIVSSIINEELIYQITQKLWDAGTLEYLADGHPKGRAVQIDTALIGISIPLHSGARRFYSELGISMTGIPTDDQLK